MNEAKNAIDLIENAPDKVAKTFISSLLASKAITRINERKFEIDEEANRPCGKTTLLKKPLPRVTKMIWHSIQNSKKSFS